MFKQLRQSLDARGIHIRRAQNFEGIDPYLDLRKLIQPNDADVAFDVGSNCGQTVASIKKVFPHLPVHGFEPVQESFRLAQLHCAAFDGVMLVNAAVGAEPGTVTLYSAGASQLASLRDTAPGAGKVANTVDVITLDDHALAQCIESVFLLKSDTEGFDLAVLQGAGRLFEQQRVASVLCEVGFSRNDASHTYFPNVLTLMEDRGFTLASLYDLPGFWHLREWGYTFGNALFVRRDLLEPGRSSAGH